jgi:hypothetical protein
LNKIFDELQIPGTQEVKKRKNDYQKRQGVTQKPITTDESVLSAPKGLHVRMRTEDFMQHVIYRARAKVQKMGAGSRYTAIEKMNLELSKKECIDVIHQDTGLLMDSPCPDGGNTDTGGNAWRFFSPEIVPALKKLLPEESQDVVLEIHYKLSVILRVASSTRQVHVPEFQDLCTSAYLLILELGWVRLSESVHDLLGHSWQLIAANDGFGLGQVIEQGSEGNTYLIHPFFVLFWLILVLPRAVFHGVSRGSSKVSLGPAIPYYSMPCGWPTPCQANGYQGVSHPQD